MTDANYPDFTSAFGGSADMPGLAALVQVENDPKRSSRHDNAVINFHSAFKSVVRFSLSCRTILGLPAVNNDYPGELSADQNEKGEHPENVMHDQLLS
jgi:hypothetical protein